MDIDLSQSLHVFNCVYFLFSTTTYARALHVLDRSNRIQVSHVDKCHLIIAIFADKPHFTFTRLIIPSVAEFRPHVDAILLPAEILIRFMLCPANVFHTVLCEVACSCVSHPPLKIVRRPETMSGRPQPIDSVVTRSV